MAKLSIIILVLTFSTLGCRSRPTDCSSVKTGIFYYKSRVDGNQFVFIRGVDLQKEIRGRDTATLAIHWMNNCQYALSYISATSGITSEEKKYGQIYVRIDLISDRYYLFTAGADSTLSGPVLRDTVWLRPPETWRGNSSHMRIPTPMPIPARSSRTSSTGNPK